jgi:hypothetical protein
VVSFMFAADRSAASWGALASGHELALKPRAQRARRGRSHAQAEGRAWRAGLNAGGPDARSPH